MSNIDLIDRLADEGVLSVEEFTELLSTYTAPDRDRAASLAYRMARAEFGCDLHAWGVIDISNICVRDCYYCGICRANEDVERYRLTVSEVLACCAEGHRLGFRTFLLRSAEDPEITDDFVEDMIWQIRKRFPGSAIALALGEHSRQTYERYFSAGADRYLLRHESADPEHYAQLHPRRMTLANRTRALQDLKDIGFQTGPGMLVGAPHQTAERLAKDLVFLADFDPALASVGAFLPTPGTKYAETPPGSLEKTLFVLSLVRIMLPDAGIPVLPSVASLHSRAREMAVMAGANILLPNLTPTVERGKFAPYDGLLTLGAEAADGFEKLTHRMGAIGYGFACDRGDLPVRH